MLADFQQAFADLASSPDLCVRARLDAGLLARSYRLTDREQRRLVPCVERELVFVGSHRRAWQGAPTQADWGICGGGATPPGASRALKTQADFRHRALATLVAHDGMEINCMVYRANRLAPLALNLPEVCQALGADLRPVAIEFWTAYPSADAQFLLEASKFCEFLYQQLAAGRRFARNIRPVLDREAELVRVRLRASQGQV